MKLHTRQQYGIYHRDTLDNETTLVGEADTPGQAWEKIKLRYGERVNPNGADRVDVVDRKGNVVSRYTVG